MADSCHIERYKNRCWTAIVENMSPSVNISFSFCLFPTDGVLEASARIGVDIFLEIVIDRIIRMHLGN